MDIITQGLTGAVAAYAVSGRPLGRVAGLIGLVGGALADADGFLRPLADPALPHELHRHFTHALVFIPVGGLLAAAPFLLAPRLRAQRRQVLLAATVAYATHALLDNCTSYGTHLLWPFFAGRTAWDCMSIIDPIFTLTLLVGLCVALIRNAPGPARIAGSLALLYIAFGVVQHGRAGNAQRSLIASRGHMREHARVLPTLGNLVVWRSLYEHEGRLFADTLRTPLLAESRVRAGTSVPRVAVDDIPSEGIAADRVREVFMRFDDFTDGFTAEDPALAPQRRVYADMRFSIDSSGFVPLWGIAVEPFDPEPVRAVGMPRRDDVRLGRMWSDIVDPGPEFIAVSGRP